MSMAPEEKPSGMILRHMVGLILFPVIGLAVAIIWILVLTKILDIGRTGVGLGAGLIVFPVIGLIYGLLAWLPIWIIHDRRMGVMGSLRALLIGLITGLLVAIVMGGLKSFGLSDGSELFGWAVIAVTSFGAWTHNKILNP